MLNLSTMNRFFKLTFPVAFALFAGWIFFFAVVPPPQVDASRQTTPTIHPALEKALLTTPSDEFLPIMIEWARASDLAERSAGSGDKLTQREQVIAALKADAHLKTRALLDYLQSGEALAQARDIRTFWISPMISLQAQPALIQALRTRSDIVQIRLDEPIFLESFTPREEKLSQPSTPDELRWNLEMINVGLAQQALGLDGTGVVVANIDSGVDWQHPALMTHYRGYRPGGLSVHFGNWHVSTNEIYTYPGDGNGHGTHTMGTMVGDDGQGTRVGVAPGAQWIAVKVFTNNGVTYESWVHDAFEWIIAPEGDPALAPDVVNNSWGSILTEDERYRPDIQALRASGILPLFSSGNSGPDAGTTGIPAAYPESFAVGAVDDLFNPASFSSRGPSEWNEIKPEVAAPGVDILSSFPGGGYAYGDGTSMAAPHVAGVAALLLQADPTLTPEDLDGILRFTATPLGAPVPNNATGWGFVDAYLAALQVIGHGQLSGQVTRAGGNGIVNPTVAATPLGGGSPAIIQGDDTGAFSVYLAPGLYDVTASAFGFVPETLIAVQILTDTETEVAFSLEQLPQGAIFGEVTDAQSGVALSATLVVENTPLVIQTDPNTGAYSLSLPEGEWSLRIQADAHRIGHVTVNVQAGQGVQVNLALEPAPRILLVDSGRWYYGSKAVYIEDALSALDYYFHLREVRDPFGNLGSQDAPTFEELYAYDLVIWSAPLDSPGVIQVGSIITRYLETGGSLILSGQDIAFWDAGGNLAVAPIYFPDYLGGKFDGEGLVDPLTGVIASPLEGLTITLNTSDSDKEQYHPDQVEVLNPQIALPTLIWPDGEIGGLVAGGCEPYRAAWTGFGLEGAGPREVRIETLEKLMAWFAQPPAAYDVVGMGPDNVWIGAPGEVISEVIQLVNTGTQTDTYDLLVDGAPWPFTLQMPDGSPVENGAAVTIPGCTNLPLTATLSVPAGVPRDTDVDYTLTLTSQAQPSVTADILIEAKTPAPVLLMDDGRWQSFGQDYAEALDALGVAYDLVSMEGKNLKSPQILTRYDVILWTTGLDWYSPLTPAETEMFADFLHRGGRLLLTSQDLLEHRGNTSFVRDDLGIVRYTYHTTPTQVLAAPDSPLGPMGLWLLNYPYQNWSDHVIPAQDAFPILMDEQYGVVGVAHAQADFRSTFFSFPLETLSADALQKVLGQSVLWISPLGESKLILPSNAADGTTIPITLTVGSATAQTLSGVQAVLPLPPEMTLVEASLGEGWTYNLATRTLIWNGDLSPFEKIILEAEVTLASNLPDNTHLPLRATLDAGDQLILPADAEIWVNAPWVVSHLAVTPDAVWPGQETAYQMTLSNLGTLTASVRLTGTLPSALTLITSTVQASAGNIIAHWSRIDWDGSIPPGESVLISYQGEAGFWDPFDLVITWVEISAPHQELGGWAILRVIGQQYFPILGVP